ncbi:MAG: phage minor capsid protein [Angelakisella sp.]
MQEVPPDHEPYQGRQYSDEAYSKLNNSLVRRIGTLNCGHAAFPIIMGVNEPQYSPQELQQFATDNEQGVTYQGRRYTQYEAT